jgi:shikimate kinase
MPPDWFHRPVLAPVTDRDREAVRASQRIMGLDETGALDDPTKSRLRGFQALLGLSVTGALDLPTAEALDRIRSHHA